MTQPRPRTTYDRLRFHWGALQQAPDLSALADAWELFLIYHQRTWNHCEAHYGTQGFWGKLRPQFSARRKHEVLLQYVHQARHADEHGLGPIAEVRPAFTVVSAGTVLGGSRIVGGGPSYLAPGSTAKVVFHPEAIIANPVANRGVLHAPPVLNGNTRPPVLEVAADAVKFYEDLFAAIDAAGGD